MLRGFMKLNVYFKKGIFGWNKMYDGIELKIVDILFFVLKLFFCFI